MSFSDTNETPLTETPLELREMENRLQSLRPTKDPELIRTLAVFTSVQREHIPRFTDSGSRKDFVRFVRRSQLRAGIFGGLLGVLFGAVLGGLCVYIAMHGECRRCAGGVLSELAMTSPLYLVSTIGEVEAPSSVQAIARYYGELRIKSEE